MLPVNPALKAYPDDRVRNPFGRLSSGSYSAPTSPKIHELRARYEALHSTESKSAHSDLRIGQP